MKKIFYFMTVVVFLCSCSNKIVYNRNYSAQKNPNIFVFHEDSTFKYEYWQSCYTESTGTWKQINNELYLNSYIQDSLVVNYSKEKNTSDTTILNVAVNAANPDDYVCFPVVNGDFGYFFGMYRRGYYSIEVYEFIDNIYFSVVKQPFELRGNGIKNCYNSIRTQQIKPNLSVGEKLTVTININDSLFGYRVFKDERLEIKNGKIIFEDGDKKYKLSLKK